MQSIAEFTYEPNQVLAGVQIGPCYFPPYRTMPSLIEGTGRSVTICFSKQDGRPIVGIDVAAPQKWYEEMKTWLGYSAGGGTNGTVLHTSIKKTPSVNEGPATGVWLAGSGVSGGILYRPKGATRWALSTLAYGGAVDDGGSTDPRRAGHKLIEFDGLTDYCFAACQRNSDSFHGIVRSSNKGATWSEWVFGTNRNFTSMVRSRLYDHMFCAADGRGAAGTDGLWRISNLQGTAALDRMDNAGASNPGGLTDVRCVDVVQIGDKEMVGVLVGNKAGSDAKRGLWTCLVTPTYSSGGGGSVANIPPPRRVTTKQEGAARIMGYIFGDGNPDSSGSTLAGGVQMQSISPDGPLKDEMVRIANNVMGWTQGVDWKYFGAKNSFTVSKQSLVTALNTGGVSAHSTSDDLYHHALTDHAATRLQGEAFLASVIETEAVKGTSPPKLFDDARGGVYDIRIDKLAQMYSTAPNDIGAFRIGINTKCDNAKLIAYPVPLIQYPGRYPGTALADWPDAGTTGGGTGTITGYTYSWAHVYTPGATDRPQWVEMVRLSANDDAIHTDAFVGFFDANTVSSGTYPISAAAGGGTDPYYKSLVRLRSIDTGSATEEVMTNGTTVNIKTWGQSKFDHVMSFTGEPVSEKSRMGGAQYQGQDGAISDDGSMLVMAGKYVPWICPNPLAPLADVRIYPLGHGMGGLDGIYDIYQEPGTDRIWVPDDDRGGYAFVGRAEIHPTWVLADDTNGFATTNNRTNGIAPSLANPGSLLTPKDTGEGYRIDTPWGAHGSVVNTGGATTAKSIGYFEYTDAAGPTTYRMLVGTDGIWRSGTKKVTFASAGERVDWASNGNTIWVMVSDLGVYRSTDSGNTWTLWWNKAINSLQARWYGHIDNDPNSPNTLYVTFETATAVWKVPNAHTAAAGTGTTTGVPAGAVKINGGTLGLVVCGGVTFDRYLGDLWTIELPIDATSAAKWQILRKPLVASGTFTWQSYTDPDMDENCGLMKKFRVYDGEVIGTAAGYGCIRRCN